MQVMPATGQRFGITNLTDPRQNLIAGARYLRVLLAQFNANLPLVIAAYNAGEGAVQKYRNTIPPYNETRDYVTKVMASYQQRRPGIEIGDAPNPIQNAPTRTVMILRGDHPAITESW
jgi:soluble lytic murein transglycosylase-like protein